MPITLTYPEGCALVTGGTGNVGQGVVRRLAQAGVPTVFTYRSKGDFAARLEADLRAEGHQVWARQMDMGDDASILATIAFAQEVGGQLRALHVPAGAPVPFNPIADFTPEQVADFVAGDALAFFRVVHHVVPVMRRGGGGRIVLCTTMANRRVIDLDGISPFSKGAVDALIRQIAAEEAQYQITCNGVAIGVVTPAPAETVAANLPPDPGLGARDEAGMFSSVFNRVWKMARLGRIATPDEAGDLFAFLASDQARYLTGQIVAIDGGSTL
ncbi:SDR family NAD(P)-dependent oxidoreductase [Novosphingobium bradum]|uniref:SDR family NAD(P)-dependent oxidoreductase n=1 Tax=Novosphingobium bradum TaxID=1737444 RepID=A0ABV7IM84_9SPHN